LEGALKLKEISYIHAEGGCAAELKHGPLALIDEEMPVVFIVPRDDIYDKVKNNMEQVKTRKGIIVAITNDDDEDMQRLANFIIKVPKSVDELSPLINVVPLQLLAYHIADLKGFNVDQPRNLAKSVTVE
jgi:glucosamine--fructose-6-phosphate aminotransferase (isomerizing)